MTKHSESMLPHLQHVFKLLKVDVTKEQLDKFAMFDDFLIEYNEKINLTRIVDPLEVAVKHFGDSVALLTLTTLFPGAKVIDVGAGAGFPGIPLAIMRPDLKFTLVDSLRKRTVFLSELTENLSLNNVEVVWGRAEDIGQNTEYREKHDTVIARAVAPLNALAELCLPLIRIGGAFFAMKGPKAEAEVSLAEKAIAILGGKVVSFDSVLLPLIEDSRSLVTISKNSSTPRTYPRKAGVPERQPL